MTAISRYVAGLASLFLLAGCHASGPQNDTVSTENATAPEAGPSNAQAIDTMAAEPLAPASNAAGNGGESDGNHAQDETLAQRIIDRNKRSIAESDTIIDGIKKFEAEDPAKLRRLEAMCRKENVVTYDNDGNQKVFDCIKAGW
jgi:PBP1b-binding outer membrane lipoprotein LpoB